MTLLLASWFWIGAMWFILDDNYNLDGFYGVRIIIIWPFVIIFWFLFTSLVFIFIACIPLLHWMHKVILRVRKND